MSDAYAAAGVDTDQADRAVSALVSVLSTIETGAPSRVVATLAVPPDQMVLDVGPKTVAILYRELRITSLDDLAAAAKAQRIRGIKGMGLKKEQLILQAIEERQRFAGRHLLSRATEMADSLVAYLKEQAPAAEIATVGSVRRGSETSGDLDILASGADTTLADAFTRFPLVERVRVGLLDGEVVDHRDRLGADADEVVDVHRDAVDADRLEPAGLLGDDDLRADAVGCDCDPERVTDA